MVDNIKDIKDKFSGFTPYINGYQNMKRASVLIPIIKRNNSYEILFEVRSKTLRSQPNEIAFPGGKIEKGEDPQTACIRETCEEIGITQDDIDLMAKLVYAESRGEPFEGKVAVASVVLNRLLNPGFPNSIKGVIFQTNAFSCVRDRDIKANPDQSCYDAVYEAINGKDPTNEALYFYNPAIATCSWMKQTQKKDTKSIGNHVFFKC